MKPVCRTSTPFHGGPTKGGSRAPSSSLKTCEAGLESGEQPCRDPRDLHILALLNHLPFCQDCGIDSIDELRFGEDPMLYQCDQNTLAYDHCRLPFGIEVGLPTPAAPIMAPHYALSPSGRAVLRSKTS